VSQIGQEREYAIACGKSAGDAIGEMLNAAVSKELSEKERVQRFHECERLFNHEVGELKKLMSECWNSRG